MIDSSLSFSHFLSKSVFCRAQLLLSQLVVIKQNILNYFTHHLLQVNGTYPPRLLLHLVHTFLGQVEVGLQMMSHHGESEHTHQYDGPQTQRIIRLLSHPEINRKAKLRKR